MIRIPGPFRANRLGPVQTFWRNGPSGFQRCLHGHIAAESALTTERLRAMEVNNMAILGLLLLLAGAGLAVDVVLQNTSSISVDAVGETLSLSPGWLFVAGMATGVIAMLGVSMLIAGMARARRRRGALVNSRSSVQDLQAERDRLAVALERERAPRTSTTGSRHNGSAGRDDESAMIDLADGHERAADRREPVESGR